VIFFYFLGHKDPLLVLLSSYSKGYFAKINDYSQHYPTSLSTELRKCPPRCKNARMHIYTQSVRVRTDLSGLWGAWSTSL
jgi:hypothetical protein